MQSCPQSTGDLGALAVRSLSNSVSGLGQSRTRHGRLLEERLKIRPYALASYGYRYRATR
jgi:hypothetical protein